MRFGKEKRERTCVRWIIGFDDLRRLLQWDPMILGVGALSSPGLEGNGADGVYQ